MLNVKCPSCDANMKLSKPKAGDFSPTCKHCQVQLKLSIRQLPNGSFKHKASLPLENSQAETNASPPKATDGPTQTDDPISKPKRRNLGPYRLIKKLGQGGMGAVFLANQTSLDRQVALKVVKPSLADNPGVMARFTREAYAAAQLIHPNVVQIYDMGQDDGKSYFSMEYVKGKTLRELAGKKPLKPETAAGYILQAARGLQCAHQAGMVHRDIKPGNLLVNQEGLVKVADLGLVKVEGLSEIEGQNISDMVKISASQDITKLGATIGTPYYMAPEQAQWGDVDHRADIYSLGCTFYVLLTGKRPFEGKTADEIASQHASAKLVEPHRVSEDVPEELSAMVTKMMAKQPGDRFQNMADVIDQLEEFLGLKQAGMSTLSENDAIAIENAGREFNAAPLASVRGLAVLALIAVAFLFAVVTSWINWKLAASFCLMPLFAIAAYFVTSGIHHSSILFEKTRELIARSSLLDRGKWIAAATLLIIATYLLGMTPFLIFVAVLGIGLGIGYHLLIDLPTASAREPAIEAANNLIRRWRVKGVDETSLQTFVAKHAPPAWEEFFESLFGYAAKRRIRKQVSAELGKPKPKFRAWRDRIHDRLTGSLKTLSDDDDRRHLRNVEQAGLMGAGLSADEALSQASQIADALVDHGTSLRIAQLEKRLAKADPKFEREKTRESIKRNLADAKSGKYKRKRSKADTIDPKLDRLLGGFPRFLLGCLLVLGSTLWAQQNDLLLSAAQFRALGEHSFDAVKDQATGPDEKAADQVATSIKQQGQLLLDAVAAKPTRPWLVLFYSFDSLIAGLVLIGSAIIGGWRMAIFILPAALIALLGNALGVPDLLPVEIPNLNKTTTLIAFTLLVMGVIFGRRED